MPVPDDRKMSPVIRERKAIAKDSGWKPGKISPSQHGKLWPRTLSLRSGWEWRSLALSADGPQGDGYVCLFQVNGGLAKFKALFIQPGTAPGAGRLLARCEHYPGRNGGLHVHAHCPDIPEDSGPATIQPPHRLPGHDANHRRSAAVSRDDFFILACEMFRIDSPEAKQHSLNLDASGEKP